MSKKLRLLIIFGGKSTEHEISLRSARNIAESLDPERFECSFVGITKTGGWQIIDDFHLLTGSRSLLSERICETSSQALPVLRRIEDCGIDAVFPVLHGHMGEDGSIQGILKLLDIPFVGPDILGSAIGLDKDVSKRLLREGGLPVVKFQCLVRHRRQDCSFDFIEETLGLPFVVKPANCGSSVGISIVRERESFSRALDNAFAYDNKVLMEEFVQGRELECGVMGNEAPVASVVGEVRPKKSFYSYELKYIDEHGAELLAPAPIPTDVSKAIQAMACSAYSALCCEGMARVDFFLKDNGTLIINEINTIPGFTNMSMFPLLWHVSGVSYSKLIENLVLLAIDRHARDTKMQRNYVAPNDLRHQSVIDEALCSQINSSNHPLVDEMGKNRKSQPTARANQEKCAACVEIA